MIYQVLTVTWPGPQVPPHPGAAQAVLTASCPLWHMSRLSLQLSGFCLWMLWKQELTVQPLDFHNSPHFLWEWRDREAPWDCSPGVGKVDTPMPCRKSGIFLSWNGFQSLKQEPDKLLPLSLLTLWLDRQSLFILTCEPFFSKSLPDSCILNNFSQLRLQQKQNIEHI